MAPPIKIGPSAANALPAGIFPVSTNAISPDAPATTSPEICGRADVAQPGMSVPGILRPLDAFWSRPSDPDAAAHQDFAKLESASGKKPVAGLSNSQLRQIYREAIQNPVADLNAVARYDPDGTIGFCFGRAMCAHLLARRQGLARESVGKLFIIGDLRSDAAKPEWRFHVTTVVKGNNGAWYAIDPIMHEDGRPFAPLKVSEWIRAVRGGWDSWHGGTPKAKLYFTPVNAVLPDITTLPEPEDATRIIQLNFDPAGRGLKSDAELLEKFGLPSDTETIHGLDTEQTKTFFLTTDEAPESRFNFVDIRINGETIPYRGYFIELLASLKSPYEARTLAAPRVSMKADIARRHGGSFDLNRILQR